VGVSGVAERCWELLPRLAQLLASLAASTWRGLGGWRGRPNTFCFLEPQSMNVSRSIPTRRSVYKEVENRYS